MLNEKVMEILEDIQSSIYLDLEKKMFYCGSITYPCFCTGCGGEIIRTEN